MVGLFEIVGLQKYDKDLHDGIPARPYFWQALKPHPWEEDYWQRVLTPFEEALEGYMY